MTALLYRCSPLSAWILPKQCDTNKKIADKASKAEPGSDVAIAGLVIRDTCPACPGVVVLSSRDRIEPREAEAGPKGGRRKARRRQYTKKYELNKGSKERCHKAKEVKMASEFWKAKTLQRPLVRDVLEGMKVDLVEFERRYNDVCEDGKRGFRGKPPTEEEIALVESFQKNGDVQALRKALGCGANRTSNIVTRVVAWQAQKRGKAA